MIGRLSARSDERIAGAVGHTVTPFPRPDSEGVAMTENRTTAARPAPSAGDIISRVIFGGFWSLVAVGAFVGGIATIAGGAMQGFLLLLLGGLISLYALYIFRGGRIRFLIF
jgi:hypothetical protein